jgi:hypothetical protein
MAVNAFDEEMATPSLCVYNDDAMYSIKAAFFLTILIVMGAFCGSSARADYNENAYAKSPDHPKTWVDGATRTHQELRWSPDKHLLLADVTYSTADFADGPHPTQEDDFVLTFPTVHFDPASGKFTAGGVVVATLHGGILGHDVSLDPKVELSIHRHHGVVYGALIPHYDSD